MYWSTEIVLSNSIGGAHDSGSNREAGPGRRRSGTDALEQRGRRSGRADHRRVPGGNAGKPSRVRRNGLFIVGGRFAERATAYRFAESSAAVAPVLLRSCVSCKSPLDKRFRRWMS